MSTLLLSWLFLNAALAQQPRTSNSADLCNIQGVVIKAGTGEPLKKANVIVWRDEGRHQEMGTTTDAMGRFELKGLDPGRYRLFVDRNGYVAQAYGEASPEGRGSVLELFPGQKLSNITIQLLPAAVISGHVYDEDGEPLLHAEVSALRYSYVNGQRQLVSFQHAETNDLGEFRLYELAPGQYFVRANYRPRWPAAQTHQGFAPLYYPGVPDAARAAPITVRAGDEFPSVDITLQSIHTVTLRGHVVGSVGVEPGTGAVVYLDPQGPTVSGRDFSSSVGVDGPPWTFELRNVPGGDYFLSATLGEQASGRQRIEVNDADIEGITLTVGPGVNIRGCLRVEGNANSSLKSFQVSLEPADGRVSYHDVPYDQVKPDGSFVLKNAFDDDYIVRVAPLPDNYFLRSARLNGIDVLTAGLVVDSKQAPGLLDIVMSPNGATLDGVVSKDGHVFPGATVAIVPDPPHRGERRLFKDTSTDQFGHFVLRGIPPGDYKVFAWESAEVGAYTSTEFLQPYEKLGESVHITESSHKSVLVELIPAKGSGP